MRYVRIITAIILLVLGGYGCSSNSANSHPWKNTYVDVHPSTLITVPGGINTIPGTVVIILDFGVGREITGAQKNEFLNAKAVLTNAHGGIYDCIGVNIFESVSSKRIQLLLGNYLRNEEAK